MEKKVINFGGCNSFVVEPTNNWRVVHVTMKVKEYALATFDYNYCYRSYSDYFSHTSGACENGKLGIKHGLHFIDCLSLQDIMLYPDDVQTVKERKKMLHYLTDFGHILIGRSIINTQEEKPIINAVLNAVSCYYWQDFDIRKSKHVIIRIEIPPCLEIAVRKAADEIRSLFPSALSDILIICGIIDKVNMACVSVIAAGGNNSEDVIITEHSPMFPKFRLPIKGVNKDEYLRMLVMNCAKERYGETLSESVLKRIKYELGIIAWYKSADYFLIWNEIVSVAKKEFSACIGPGRGSAAGSIVNYCLGITDIDPLKYGLLFERFFSLKRKKAFPMIDIDIDFDVESRDKIVEWVEWKYGDHFAHISTYNFNKDGEVDKVGIHQCGVVLCQKPIRDVVMLRTVMDGNGKDVTCTVYGGWNVEDIGLIKLDFLCLKELSIIREVLKSTNIKVSDIPLDDDKTMNLFQEGNTGKVFMFEGRTMRKYLRQMHPTKFSDLVLLYAMFRPGSLDGLPALIERKNHQESIEYVVPCIENVLDETYGVIVYQEQIMSIAQVVAGFTPKESDRLRKAISKKKASDLKILKPKFLKCGILNGNGKDVMPRLWNKMNDEGLYAFNKSHAVCYTNISYVLAYLKAHYPTIYNRTYKKYHKEESK